VRPDLRIDLWLLLLRTAVEGLMNPQRVLREGLAASEMVEVLRMVLFEGILTPEGRAALRRLRLTLPGPTPHLQAPKGPRARREALDALGLILADPAPGAHAALRARALLRRATTPRGSP
jgi:hypothetical protein